MSFTRSFARLTLLAAVGSSLAACSSSPDAEAEAIDGADSERVAGSERHDATDAPSVPAATLEVQSASWCRTPPRGTCDFYVSCLEADKPCGADGYARSYGDKYCRRFNAETRFSPAGAYWRDQTLSCLQRNLVRYLGPSSATCEDVTEAAFNSHPQCYTQVGSSICDLPYDDMGIIVLTVDFGDYWSTRAVRQVYETATTCLVGWASELRSVEDAALDFAQGREPDATKREVLRANSAHAADLRNKIRLVEDLGARLELRSAVAPPAPSARATTSP